MTSQLSPSTAARGSVGRSRFATTVETDTGDDVDEDDNYDDNDENNDDVNYDDDNDDDIQGGDQEMRQEEQLESEGGIILNMGHMGNPKRCLTIKYNNHN